MIKVKKLIKLKGDKKKYEIIFEKNGKEYKRKFGASGMSDFTIHKDLERRERYISRHKKDLLTNDPIRAGYLSMYILWNKPTLKGSLEDYKRRLNIYNKTGKFPKGITGSKKLSFGMIKKLNKSDSKIPDNVLNKKLYTSIKNKIRKTIKDRRWGAYDSGRLVREYKAAGGKYSGKKGKTDLGRWYKEKWVDACAWPNIKPCGRKTKEKIAYCRPIIKVDSKTPVLVKNLTKSQIKTRCEKKKKNPMERITKFSKKSILSFGTSKEVLDKFRQQMYTEIFSYGNLNENIQKTIKKRCKKGFSSSFCQDIFTQLILSMYLSIVKKSKITEKRKKNLEEMKQFIPQNFEPTIIKMKADDFSKIEEFLYLLQDHSYGLFKNARLASLMYEYIYQK